MAANTQARTITANAAYDKGILDITSLVLLAVLLAASFILNMTVGNALAATGIKPQFIIAAYALAIALTQASFAQAAIFGILSAAVIQITTSIPGLNFVTELAGALTMAARRQVKHRRQQGQSLHRRSAHHPGLGCPLRRPGHRHHGCRAAHGARQGAHRARHRRLQRRRGPGPLLPPPQGAQQIA